MHVGYVNQFNHEIVFIFYEFNNKFFPIKNKLDVYRLQKNNTPTSIKVKLCDKLIDFLTCIKKV